METARPLPLQVIVSPRKMPRRTRNVVLLVLGLALCIAVIAMTWVLPPTNLILGVFWILFVLLACVIIGLYSAGLVIPVVVCIDDQAIRMRQWRLKKGIEFSKVQRLYLFSEGPLDRLAIVPKEGPLWYLGLGLSKSELDSVVLRLDSIATEKGIEFQKGLTFLEVWEKEDRRVKEI